MKHCLLAALALTLCAACVPKDQYDALVIERDYYRNKTVAADSIADVEALQTYNQVDNTGTREREMIRELEGLKATNKAINDSYQMLQGRYDDLLRENQQLLANSGQEVTDLQQSLAQRTKDLSRREAELRQLEIDLRAREEAMGRQSGTATAPTGGVVLPQGGSRPALSASDNAALRLNEVQSDLNQLLAYLPAGSYVVRPMSNNRLQVSLAESTLTDDGYAMSPAGTALLRKIASSLRNYPRVEVSVIGHAGGDEEDPQEAYEQSTDKAIGVGQALIDYGVSPSAVTVSGKGYYAPIAESATEEGRRTNRRLEMVLTVSE